jgi:hypothetical protein
MDWNDDGRGRLESDLDGLRRQAEAAALEARRM